jgi:hypothetical protein
MFPRLIARLDINNILTTLLATGELSVPTLFTLELIRELMMPPIRRPVHGSALLAIK